MVFKYDYIESGLATILHFTYPIFVVIILFLFLHEKIGKKQILCLILSVIGISLLFSFGKSNNVLGMILALASGASYSAYIVLLRKSDLESVPLMVTSFWISVFSAVEIFIASMAS